MFFHRHRTEELRVSDVFMLLTRQYTGIKEAYPTEKLMWDQVLTPRRSSPHMLAQRQTRANNHLQIRTERPASLLSPEHQTQVLVDRSTGAEQAQSQALGTEHTEYPRDDKIIHEGLYI